MWPRRRRPEPSTPTWVPLLHVSHQPEADLVVNMLEQEGIPAFHRRAAAFDVPDFLASGARMIMVRPDDLERARALVDPFDWTRAPGDG